MKPGGKLHRELNNITKAPLKPQQCMKILRCFLVPKYYHLLVLSVCLENSEGTWRSSEDSDQQVVESDSWHAARLFPLPLQGWWTWYLVIQNFFVMSESASAAVRDAFNHPTVVKPRGGPRGFWPMVVQSSIHPPSVQTTGRNWKQTQHSIVTLSAYWHGWPC